MKISSQRRTSPFFKSVIAKTGRVLFFALWLSLLLLPGAVGSQGEEKLLKSFPTAEGFGAFTPGGRGGKIVYVTTLEDFVPSQDPPIPGSLRWAIDMDGPRYVLFQISGTISLKSDLWIQKPFLTIAGQTAPGDGICIKDYMVVLATNDIVIRHVRFRSGDLTRKEQMSVGIFGGNNSILDHCSLSWAIDEVMSAFGSVHNLTVQWSIIAEGLSKSFHPKGEHSMGSIITGDGGITIHHCLYAHNMSRNPRVNNCVLDFGNNVIYNWGKRCAYTTDDACHVNWVSNYLKPGPNTSKKSALRIFEPGNELARVFFANNILEGHPEYSSDNSLMMAPIRKPELTNVPPKELVRDQPYPTVSFNPDSAETAYQRILEDVGATLPRRDSLDGLLLNEVRDGGGKLINSSNERGGWPNLVSNPPRPDADQDGTPNDWEVKNHLNPQQSADSLLDSDGDGYPNLEEYLNGTDPWNRETGCTAPAAEILARQTEAIELTRQGATVKENLKAEKENLRKSVREDRIKSIQLEIYPDSSVRQGNLLIHIDHQPLLEMVFIPAGSFMMGTPESEGGLDREHPQHKVNISRDFYLAATPATTKQFCAVMGAQSRELTDLNANLPVKEATWLEAVEFCEILSAVSGRKFRLPTEAEWEYACRAGTTTAFYTGETISSDQANFNAEEATRYNPSGEFRNRFVDVKTFPPNPWGLYDMPGNEAEYCQDYAFRKYTVEETTDPIGTEDQSGRVLRGGKSGSKAFYLRSGYRYSYHPGVGYGFRGVMEIP